MPLLPVFGSTAMAPFIMCDIQFHPPELVWAEHWSPSTCGLSCLQLLWLFDIRLPHIIPCMLCLNPPWLVIGPDCDPWLSHYTECEKSACSCCQFMDVVSSYSIDTAVFTDRLYKFYSCGLTLKTGFSPVTSIDLVVSNVKSSFMPIGGGIITQPATHLMHRCMGSRHTFVNFMLHVVAVTIFWSNDIFTISSFMHIVSKTYCAISLSVTGNMSEVLVFVISICHAPLMWTFMNSVNFDIGVCAQ